jgi:hypothetical protein
VLVNQIAITHQFTFSPKVDMSHFSRLLPVCGDVSHDNLCTQPLFRDRIEALRQRQQEQRVRERIARPTGKTDAGKDLVILAKERRVKELEEENRKLKQQLKAALGKAYDRL